jgi:hypothetical protein
MSHFETAFMQALRLALAAGEIEAPERLLAATAAAGPNALEALGDPERSQYLFFALQDEFGFVVYLRITGNPPSEASQRLWAASLRWLIQGLSTWSVASDPTGAVLCALLAFTAFNNNPSLWDALPDHIGKNRELCAALKSILSSMKGEYSV